MGNGQAAPSAERAPCSKSCRPCGDWGKKDYNTVKVDTAALQACGKDKENAGPNGNAMSKEEQERQREIQERERRLEEARRAEEQRRVMEQRVREEQERQQAEQRRKEEERRRLQAEQEQREREELQRRQEEERRRHEELRRQEEERVAAAAEQARQLEETRRLRQLEIENKKKTAAWLKDNGFKSMDELARKRMSKVRPLHVAVQKNEVELVKMLLAAGADRRLPNGSKQIPLEFAQKLDKQGSHSAVIMALLDQPAAQSS